VYLQMTVQLEKVSPREKPNKSGTVLK